MHKKKKKKKENLSVIQPNNEMKVQ